MNQTSKGRGKLYSMIDSYYPSLTKSEQKVADKLKEDFEQVLSCSVTELADISGVGETTALRFCRKLGFKGYQDFKLAVAQGLSSATQEEGHTETELTLQNTIASTMKGVIDETVHMIDEQTLEDSIALLQKAKNIYFFGVGTSGITAQDAKNRFLRIGVRSDAIVDPHIQSMVGSTLSNEDVVVGISVSGSTKDTIDSLEVAKENGAKVITITYFARSPITKFADYVLLNGGKESPLEGGSLGAKISQLFIIDLLCTGLAMSDKETAIRMKERTAKAVLGKIY